MRKQVDLLNGPIFPTLTGLALPIMATSLVQMAYNLTDMAWVGFPCSGGSGKRRNVYMAVSGSYDAAKDGWTDQGGPFVRRGKKGRSSPLCPGISPAWNFVCSAVFCSGSVPVPATDQFFWIK